MNIFKTIKNKANEIAVKAVIKKNEIQSQMSEAAADETGANTHVDVSIWMIIGCTVGGILLGVIVTLINNVVNPGITTAIKDLFKA